MNKALLVTFTFIFVLSGYELSANDDDKKMTRPVVTITGDDSKISQQKFHRIRSIDDWAKVWQQHSGQGDVKYKNFKNEYDKFYNTLNLPLVDFDNYMVIAILRGSGWNNAGLRAESISESPDGITFRFVDKGYSTTGPDGGGKEVNVYGFFIVPRSNKPLILEEQSYEEDPEKLANAKKLNLPFDKSQLYKTTWKQCFKFDAVK